MLDTGDALATWQVSDDPASLTAQAPENSARAKRLADHRRAYLDYEGPVSGNRGQVKRHDRGTYEMIEHRPGLLVVRLAGAVLRGTYHLVACGGPDGPWELRRVVP